MKNTLVLTSLIPVLAVAAVAQLAAPVSLPGLNPTALVGGLVATGVLAFALRDYSRRPALRVRRTRKAAAPMQAASEPTPAIANAAWTYHTTCA